MPELSDLVVTFGPTAGLVAWMIMNDRKSKSDAPKVNPGESLIVELRSISDRQIVILEKLQHIERTLDR